MSSTGHSSSEGRILDRVGSGGRAAPRGCRLMTSTAGGLLAAGCWLLASRHPLWAHGSVSKMWGGCEKQAMRRESCNADSRFPVFCIENLPV